MSLHTNTSGVLVNASPIMIQVPRAIQREFVCNFGQSHIFTPTNQDKFTRSNGLLVYSDFIDMFEDRTNHDYRVKNIDSKVYQKGITKKDFSPTVTANTFIKDFIGNPRPGPLVCIGALELIMSLELGGSNLVTVSEKKLSFNGDSFVSDEDGEVFDRIVGLIPGTPEEYVLEKKVFLEIKSTIKNSNIVTDKSYKILYEFDALYESENQKFVLFKSSNFNSGLLLNLIGKDQYIISYSDLTRKLSIGMLDKVNSGTSGSYSILNAVKFG